MAKTAQRQDKKTIARAYLWNNYSEGELGKMLPLQFIYELLITCFHKKRLRFFLLIFLCKYEFCRQKNRIGQQNCENLFMV